jgi:hypothetical protein
MSSLYSKDVLLGERKGWIGNQGDEVDMRVAAINVSRLQLEQRAAQFSCLRCDPATT